ncbi:hypothetical protein LFL96_00875 [Paraburkholderia sp. D15]|uniref:hypothetical protein n=1 Tax=Paraburkholderia sp. D15 TaxID=2880218 RepID=UPI002478FB5B|nr:hypothetical protein [Paraburkholderia sp. D15]WGS50095.1 hypothetical protein LFL96_00875 [Paraburkholderia sp. D15]
MRAFYPGHRKNRANAFEKNLSNQPLMKTKSIRVLVPLKRLRQNTRLFQAPIKNRAQTGTRFFVDRRSALYAQRIHAIRNMYRPDGISA